MSDQLSDIDLAVIELLRARYAVAPDKWAFVRERVAHTLDDWKRAHVALGFFIQDAEAELDGREAFNLFNHHREAAQRAAGLIAIAVAEAERDGEGEQ